MSRGLRSPKRFGRLLVVSSVLAVIASVFYAPSAFAQTACTFAPVNGVDTLTVNMAADQTVALNNIGGTVRVAEDVNAGATDFFTHLVAACGGGAGTTPEQIIINGTDAGVETVKMIEAGTTGGTTDFGDFITFVDLGAGNDTLEFMSADTAAIGLAATPPIRIALGTSGAGTAQTVADQGVTEGGANTRAECQDTAGAVNDINFNGGAFDCTDLVVADANNLRVTGGGNPALADLVDAQGDFDDGLVDFNPAGVGPEDTVAPGTAGHEGLDSEAALGGDNNDNEPNGGNLDQVLNANLNAGNDNIAPGDGNDTLDGAGGFDFVSYQEAEAAVEVDLGVGGAAGTATGGSGTDSLANFQDVTGTAFDDTLLGSDLANSLFGFCGNDFINGRTEDDIEIGDGGAAGLLFTYGCVEPDGVPDFGFGDDTFYQETGSNGADTIVGGPESDVFAPQAPDFFDTVDYGDRTADLYLDANGAPSGEGGCTPPPAVGCEGDSLNGLEYFIAGSGNDAFNGSGADETFQGGAGNDNMSGGGGEDWFDFSDSAAAVTVDVVAGTATGNGDDTFDGTVEGFLGSEQGDTFNDDTASDNIYWGAGGDDVFNQGASPSADADAFNGGDGVDLLNYGDRTEDLFICLNGENPIVLFGCDPADNGEGPETDLVQDDIENANAGSGDDVIVGNERENVLSDGDGNDLAFGDQGNDTFQQSDHPNGSDDLIGGAGADFVDYSLRTGNVRVSLGQTSSNNGENCVPGATVECEGDGLSNVENASTGAGNDLLVGSSEDNLLNAGAGNDLVNGAGGQDVLDGGDGVDRVTYATGVGVKINLANGTAAEIGGGTAGGLDTLGGFENATGSMKADIIAGDAGNNKLAGLAGKDIIKGKKGDDKLKGNQGRDNLNGGKGNDRGNGGPGRDKCRKIEHKTSCEA